MIGFKPCKKPIKRVILAKCSLEGGMTLLDCEYYSRRAGCSKHPNATIHHNFNGVMMRELIIVDSPMRVNERQQSCITGRQRNDGVILRHGKPSFSYAHNYLLPHCSIKLLVLLNSTKKQCPNCMASYAIVFACALFSN